MKDEIDRLSFAGLLVINALELTSYFGIIGLYSVYLGDAHNGSYIDIEQIAAYYAGFSILSLVLLIPTGLLMDFRTGKRNGLLIGCALSTLGSGIILLNTVPFFLVGLFIITLGLGFRSISILTLLDRITLGQRNKRLSGLFLLYGSGQLSIFISQLITKGFVDQAYYQSNFITFFTLSLLALVVALVVSSRLKRQQEGEDSSFVTQNKRYYWTAAVATMVFSLSFYLYTSDFFMNAYQSESLDSTSPDMRHIDIQRSSYAISVLAAIFVAIAIYTQSKLKLWKVMFLGAILFAVVLISQTVIGTLELSPGQQFSGSFILYALIGVAIMLVNCESQSIVLTNSSSKYKNTWVAVYMVGLELPTVVFGTFLLQLPGLQGNLTLFSLLIILPIITLLLVMRKQANQVGPQET